MKELIIQLKRYVNIHGAARVAVDLGYRDTRTINAWLTRDKIPVHAIAKVEEMLNVAVKKHKKRN